MVAAGANPLNTNITQSPDNRDNRVPTMETIIFEKLSKN